jgi:hypothetical protein
MTTSVRAALALLFGLAPLAAVLLVACSDLFHDTDWPTGCDLDASAPGCPGVDHDAGTTTTTTGSGGGGGCDAADCHLPVGLALSEPTPTSQFGSLDAGTAYDDPCPEGQAVVGYAGNLSVPAMGTPRHGQIQARCGAPNLSDGGPYVVTVGPGDTLPLRGDAGTIGWESSCPADEVVVGFVGRNGWLLDELSLRCAPLVVTGPPYDVAVGKVSQVAPVGGDGGAPFPETFCAPNEIATVSRVRAGTDVAAFGLACSKVSLTY